MVLFVSISLRTETGASYGDSENELVSRLAQAWSVQPLGCSSFLPALGTASPTASRGRETMRHWRPELPSVVPSSDKDMLRTAVLRSLSVPEQLLCPVSSGLLMMA